MVVDTSALIAVLFGEPEEPIFTAAIEDDPTPKLSAVSWLEANMVYLGRHPSADSRILARVVDLLGLTIVPVDEDQAERGLGAFLRFGRGRHPAGLNLGDCFAYALAATVSEPLLFKGDDFLKTDIVPAWHP
jgi:ribonuclease VapC